MALANKRRSDAGLPPLPQITPHSLRRTFASILAALGEPMPSVIRQLGHTDPTLTLRIYAHDMARGEEERRGESEQHGSCEPTPRVCRRSFR